MPASMPTSLPGSPTFISKYKNGKYPMLNTISNWDINPDLKTLNLKHQMKQIRLHMSPD